MGARPPSLSPGRKDRQGRCPAGLCVPGDQAVLGAFDAREESTVRRQDLAVKLEAGTKRAQALAIPVGKIGGWTCIHGLPDVPVLWYTGVCT